jgi:hypothetical protein
VQDSRDVSVPELKSGLPAKTGRRYLLRVASRLLEATWSVAEARPGETVELRTKLRHVESGERVRLRIFRGDCPERGEVVAELEARAEGDRACASWSVRLPGSAAIPEIGDGEGPRAEAGRPVAGAAAYDLRFEAAIEGLGKEAVLSGSLRVGRRVEVDFDAAETGSRLAGAPYLLIFTGGTVRRGQLDAGGKLVEGACPPEAYAVSLGGRRFPRPYLWRKEIAAAKTP